MKRAPHDPIEMKPVKATPADPITQRYSNKNWSQKFTCPTCGARVWKNANFLGRRVLLCAGTKTLTSPREV